MIMRKPLVHILLIVVAGFVVYSNTFHVPFVWDDERLMVKNPFVRNIDFPLDSMKHDEELYKTTKMRYAGMLTFALNYKIHGADVVGFHVVNLIIHLFNAVLVYLFVVLTFRTPFLKVCSLKENAGYVALFSALFFVSHPVQIEAVTYIFQRLTSLATFFYLAAVVLYVKAGLLVREKELAMQGAERGNVGFLSFGSFFCYMGSLLAVVLGMFTKEITITVPIIIVIYEYFFFERSSRRGLLKLIPFGLTLFIIPFHYLFGLQRTLETATREYGFVPYERLDYFFTQFRVIVTYLRLLILPVHQNIDYDYPLYRSFLSADVILSFLLLLAILFAGGCLYIRSRITNPAFRIIAFGIIWFFIALSIESSFIPLRLLICEFRVYLPSVGFFLAVVSILFLLLERLHKKWLRFGVIFITGILLTGYAYAAYARNLLWSDEVLFWKATINESPQKFIPYHNLGLAYERLGRFEEAFEMLETARRMNPSHADTYNALGALYSKLNRFDEAEREFLIAASLKPNSINAHWSLGIIYDRMGRFSEAEKELQTAIWMDPNDDRVYNDLGTSYYLQGLFEKAVVEFRKASKLNPWNIDSYNNIGIIYDEQGRMDEALKEFQAALAIKPDDKRTHENIGIAYFHDNRLDAAVREFRTVLVLDPNSAAAQKYLETINAQRGRKGRP